MQLMSYDADLFRSPFENLYSLAQMKNSMSTDIIENENDIKVLIDIPGVKKENVKITLENSVLTISASTQSESEEKDTEGNYIRRERRSGEYTRSFNVSENLSKDDIKAKLEDGTLTLTIPKNIEKESESQTIEIE